MTLTKRGKWYIGWFQNDVEYMTTQFATEDVCIIHETCDVENCPSYTWLPSTTMTQTLTEGVDANCNDNKANICTVCLEPIKMGDRVTQFSCHHPLHHECAGKWFTWCLSHQLKLKCPMCNAVVVKAVWSVDSRTMTSLRQRNMQTALAQPSASLVARVKTSVLQSVRAVLRRFRSRAQT